MDKCLKRIVFYVNNATMDKVPRHEAYVYYTTPYPPETTLVTTTSLLGLKLDLTVFSFVVLNLYEVGVHYSLNPNVTVNDAKILFPAKFGTNSVTIPYTQFEIGTTYYFKPYTFSCIGTNFGEVSNTTILIGIGYDIIESTLIVY